MTSGSGKLAPASLPKYRIGDSFAINNPDETWRITGFDERGRLVWQSSLGAQRITSLDPMLPSLRHVAPDGRGVTRIINRSSELFPLSVGKTATFSEAAGMDEPPYSQSFEWTCSVAGEGQAKVPAGTYDIFRVDCSRSDGLTVESAYAPSIDHVVRRKIVTADGASELRELTATSKGTGPGTAPVTMAANQPPQPSEPIVQSAARQAPPVQAPPMQAPQTQAPQVQAPVPQATPVAVSVPQGALFVQVASYGNEQAARDGWSQLAASHGSALSQLRPAIKPVTITGKGTFYRLYAGPVDQAQAKRLCSSLPNMGGWCNVEALR
ncbi:MAG: SPOR domain-containing protein [Rhodospirillaceae bacterium]